MNAARNIPNTITSGWHHRGRGLSRSSFVLLAKTSFISTVARTVPPFLWHLLNFLLTTRDARCYSFYQPHAINTFTVDNMVHECLLWQVSLFGWHFKWIQHHLAYNSSQFLCDLCFSLCLQARIWTLIQLFNIFTVFLMVVKAQEHFFWDYVLILMPCL